MYIILLETYRCDHRSHSLDVKKAALTRFACLPHEMGKPRVWLPSPVLLHWLCVNSTSWIKLNLLHFFIITHSISHLLFLPLTASYIFIYNLRRQQIENCGKVWLWSNGKFPNVRTTQQPMVGKATKQLYYISYHNSKDSWGGKIIILQDYQSSQKNNVFLAIHFKFGSFLCYPLIFPVFFFFSIAVRLCFPRPHCSDCCVLWKYK